MSLLLDPLLLLPSDYPDPLEKADGIFWDAIVEWSADKRVLIGKESFEFIMEAYAKYGYPHQSLHEAIPSLRKEYSSSLDSLLSRVASTDWPSAECNFTPKYEGSEDHDLVLQFDISGTSGNVRGIATSPEFWEYENSEIKINPGPPKVLELCFKANAELDYERTSALQNFFYNKRIHIVGGQVESRVLEELQTTLGLESRNLEWIPCARARPPRDLDKRWAKLEKDRDIIVCVTGRVGHATSNNAKEAAKKRKVSYLPVESSSGIVKNLMTLTLE